MEILPNFKFDVTVSDRGFTAKPTGVDYRRMVWRKQTVGLDNFVSLVRCGYSYCHIYFRNDRRNAKFLYSQVVSIDVDDSDIDLATFFNECQLKPTFAYETFSNGKEGKFRYRLVYVFKEHLSQRGLPQMYEKICRMTGLEHTRDHCGKTLSQLMNGTDRNALVLRSNRIYSSVSDLPVDDTDFD
ncbi:hypothetical protein [uncultured Muribaculum sp.]|uniref:hypothetical protein n=1 Tax=uncultured Muribaculum sp. TaxID=1918613 RepID=UPI0025EF422A|nr:hypothetical protein [uncultured Muribaculum sp.]